jgi:hypothetical protein
MPHLAFAQDVLDPGHDALLQSTFLQEACVVAAHVLPVQLLSHLRLSPA